VKGYLVDTNIPSELTREKPDARVAAFLRSTDKNSMYLSVMTIGEICKGIATLPVSQRRTTLQNWFDVDVRSWFAGRILPVTEVVAERWGHLAATAKQHGLTLAVVDGRWMPRPAKSLALRVTRVRSCRRKPFTIDLLSHRFRFTAKSSANRKLVRKRAWGDKGDVLEADFWPALLKVRPGPVGALPLAHLQLHWSRN